MSLRLRLHHFRRNARTRDVVKTAIFLPLMLALAYWILDGKDYWLFALTMVTCFFLPYLFRDGITRRLGAFMAVVDAAPYLIFVLLAVFQDHLSARPYAVLVFSCGLGIYTGAFFWVLSDPRVLWTRDGDRRYLIRAERRVPGRIV